jgi:hypothetical protein
MNVKPDKLQITLALGVAVILAIFITRPAFSQETGNKESHKKVVMKIVTTDNGKTTMIDTTMEMPDSAMMDSIRDVMEKVIMVGKGKHGRMKIRCMPQGFNYDFEMPCIPECPMGLEGFEELELEGMVPGGDMEEGDWDEMTPRSERRFMRSGGGGQTLNDMLGEIPMDRVVSYSIKDNKHGKRIIIDLNDAPTFERQDRVIVIREPGRAQHNRKSTERKVKVYMNADKDDDTKEGNTPDQSAPPPPPSPKPVKK